MSDGDGAGNDRAGDSLLARVRRTAGLTQEELADRSGLSARGIRSLELGAIKRPRQHSLEAIATALGLRDSDRDAFIGHYRGHAARVTLAGGTPPALPSRPAQLPAAPVRFTGRTAQLAQLDELRAGCAHGVITVTLDGLGGVGKTALATHWGHQRRSWFPDGQLYANLRGYGPLAPAEPAAVLAHFLRSLGVPGEQLPADIHERSALFRSLVADRELLLLLDNVRFGADVRPLFPGTAGSMVMVTGRDQLRELAIVDGAHRLAIEPLDDADATTLFDKVAGAEVAGADREAAAAIVTHCAGLPLALAVAAIRVSGEQDLSTVSTQLFDGPGLGLGQLGDGAANVESVFSWSVAALDDDAAGLFRLLGLHPGPDIGADAAAALLDSSPNEAGRLLTRLADAHLLEERRVGRYELHDLIRLYAEGLASSELSAQERDTASTRMLDYYLHTALAVAELVQPNDKLRRRPDLDPPSTAPRALSDRDEALDWLAAEDANLVALAAHTADRDGAPYTQNLADVLYRHLLISADHDTALALHTSALAAAGNRDDPAGQCRAHADLAVTHGSRGRTDTAIEHELLSLALAHETGDRSAEARATSLLGVSHRQVGRNTEAVTWLKRSLELAVAEGDEQAEGRALSALGVVHRELGQHRAAVDVLVRSIAVARRQGNELTEARSLTILGETYRRLGQYGEAVEHLDRALLIARRLGIQEVESNALNRLGQIHRSHSQHREAREYGRRARDLARSAQLPMGEADALNSLGETELAAGDREQARAAHDEALEIARRVDDPSEEARALRGLGRAAAHPTEARGRLRAALAVFQRLGVPEADEVRAELAALDDD